MRLLRSRLVYEKDYTPNLHAAQFTIYFTVQNRNKQSRGYGDLVWFGVPIYDNRSRFPRAFKEQDLAAPQSSSTHPTDATILHKQCTGRRVVVVIDKDLLPLMNDALATAWSRGFLKESTNAADYFIGGMNMGWELPGTFDVEMQVRNLSLKAMRKN